MIRLLRGFPTMTLFSKLGDLNFSFSTVFLDLMEDNYRYNVYTFKYIVWYWKTQLLYIFGLADKNTNGFESFEELFEMFTLTQLLIYLSEISNLVHTNKSRVSQSNIITTPWCIVRLSSGLVWDYLWCKGQEKTRWRENIFKFPHERTLLLLRIFLALIVPVDTSLKGILDFDSWFI